MTEHDAPRPTRVGSRVLIAGCAALAYLIFLAVTAWAVLFLAGIGPIHTIDDGGPRYDAVVAILIDASLLGVFAVQHSVMARPWFKARWTRIVPTAIERSVYVLAASGVLALLFWRWSPLPDQVWAVSGAASDILWAVYGAGWLLVVCSTCLINHFELFGLRQAYRSARNRTQAEQRFQTPWLYRLVRHPIMTGFLIVFWATPTMTVGHLIFGVLASGYIVLAVRLEEHDLIATLPEYQEYAARTPRFLPQPRRRDREPAVTPTTRSSS